MAEVCAERGYGEVSVADVTRQAAVSTASFYRQFADKRECMLASFEELFGRLLEEVGRACSGEIDPAVKLRTVIVATAGLLAADLPSARLLTVEVLAAGADGVALQHAAIESLAAELQRVRGLNSDEEPTETEAWATVAGMVALVARRAIDGEAPSAAELEEASGLS